MADDVRGVGDPRVVYDPGPSGIAVAGLIIALVALAVGLYAAFAPRQVVREGSEAVSTAWEQTVDQAQPPPAQRAPASPQAQPTPDRTPTAVEVQEMIKREVSQQSKALEADYEKWKRERAGQGKSGGGSQ